MPEIKQVKRKKKNGLARMMIVLSTIFLAFLIFLFAIFNRLYRTAGENVVQIYQNEVMTTVSEFDFYFNAAINAVTFCGNNMTVQHEDGATKEDLQRAMTIMSDTFMTYIKDNIAGAYGYIYGDYIDGHGWVPDDSYDPKSRSWYIEATNHEGELVCVPPYIDAESGQVCLTLSQTLSDDPESVVAFDIALDSIQTSINKMMTEKSIVSAKIIDRNLKEIVVSSEKDEALSDYRRVGDILENADDFEQGSNLIKSGGKTYLVFIEELAIGWDYVCIYDYAQLMSSTKGIFVSAIHAVVIFDLLVLLVFHFLFANHKKMNSVLKRSETDALTGIRNRGSGQEMISWYLSENEPGALLMLDIDKFKTINDTYGHDVGDQVIIAVAHCLEETARKNDVVMRLGGDEFVGFLSGIKKHEDIELFTGRLFEAIDNINIKEVPDLKVSVSAGVSIYDGNECIDFAELYRRADEKVYISKKTTGNCFSV